MDDSRLYSASNLVDTYSGSDDGASRDSSNGSQEPTLDDQGDILHDENSELLEFDDAENEDEDDGEYEVGLHNEEGEDINSFQGWKDGLSSDGVDWGEHPIEDEDMETLRESNSLRMEELGGESVVDGDPSDEVFDPEEDLDTEGGYTPWQFVRVSDEKVNHEITIEVAASMEDCFSVWADRLNYCQWFHLIKEMGVMPSEDPEEDEKYCGLWMRYKWGMMPELELFTVLEKTLQAVDGDKAAIMEQSVDGFPLIGSVEFVRQPDSSDGTPVTHVTLNMSYFVPEYLLEFVGSLGTYGDVNDLLAECMLTYASFCETVNVESMEVDRRRERFQAYGAARKLSDTYETNKAMALEAMAEIEAHPDFAAQAAEAQALGVDLDTGEGLDALLDSFDEGTDTVEERLDDYDDASSDDDSDDISSVMDDRQSAADTFEQDVTLADIVPKFDDYEEDKELSPAEQLAKKYGNKIQEQLQQQKEEAANEKEAAVKAETLDSDDFNSWRRAKGEAGKNKGFPGVGNEIAAANRRRGGRSAAPKAD